jgi:hypothetical protein
MKTDEITNRFTYHAPTPDQIGVYRTIRSMALNFAKYLDGILPDSREKSTAITKIDEAVMWANASIARHESEDAGD